MAAKTGIRRALSKLNLKELAKLNGVKAKYLGGSTFTPRDQRKGKRQR
jgi:hypothetical protein